MDLMDGAMKQQPKTIYDKNYDANRDFSDRFVLEVKKILGEQFLIEAPLIEDLKENTDIRSFVMWPIRYGFRVRRNRDIHFKKDFLNQAFFESVFSTCDEKPTIETIDSKYFDSEEGRKEIGETFNINCIISPIAPMDRSLVYKVEVYVEILVQKLPVSYRDKDSDFVIANLIKKYFIVDKEGLFFEEQVKKALEMCFIEIKKAFLETQKKRIYVIKKEKKAADYEPSAP